MNTLSRMTCLMGTVAAACAAPAADRLQGVCDGSALLVTGPGLVLTASDESNRVTLHDLGRSGQQVDAIDLDAALQALRDKSGGWKEADLEAVARLGDTLYWIGSHGNDRKGRAEPGRHRLLATRVLSIRPLALRPLGAPQASLLQPLLQRTDAVGQAVRAAAERAHLDGGIDIEGLAPASATSLWLGFRSPLVEGRALVVELLNPEGTTLRGEAPRLGEPLLLDLGGDGVRDLAAGLRPSDIQVLSGSAREGGQAALWAWAPPAGTPRLVHRMNDGIAWEGLALDAAAGQWLLSADDGSAGSPPCKDRPAAARAARLLRLPAR